MVALWAGGVPGCPPRSWGAAGTPLSEAPRAQGGRPAACHRSPAWPGVTSGSPRTPGAAPRHPDTPTGAGIAPRLARRGGAPTSCRARRPCPGGAAWHGRARAGPNSEGSAQNARAPPGPCTPPCAARLGEGRKKFHATQEAARPSPRLQPRPTPGSPSPPGTPRTPRSPPWPPEPAASPHHPPLGAATKK